MPQAMPEHPASICPSHAQKCHVRTNATDATHARIQDQGEQRHFLDPQNDVNNPIGVNS